MGLINYNEETINNWLQKLTDLPKKIAKLEDEKSKITYNLTNFNLLLNRIVDHLVFLQKKQHGGKRKSYRTLKHHFNEQHIELEENEASSHGIQDENFFNSREESLEQQIANQESLKKQLEEKIIVLQKKLLKIQNLHEKAHNFFQSLQKNAEQLFHSLRRCIELAFDNYQTYHFNLDIKKRLCLYKLTEKLNTIAMWEPEISNFYRENDQEEQKNHHNQIWQIRYIILCGFIWDLYNQYNYQNKNMDSHFLDLLQQLIVNAHIDQDQIFSEKIARGLNCNEHFMKVKEKNPTLFHRTERALEEAEKNDFNKIKSDVTKLAAQDQNQLGKTVLNLIRMVSCEINEQKYDSLHAIEAPKPKYYLYIRILQKLKILIENPIKKYPQDHVTNPLYQFINMRHEASGKASTRGKIIGAILCILGALLCIASAMAFVASSGFSTPLSALGIVVGTTLIWQASSLMISGTTLITAMGGICLFTASRQKGVMDAMVNTGDILQDQMRSSAS